jgi:hypothetical protein
MLLKHAKARFEAEQIFFRRVKSQDKTTIESARILSNNEVTSVSCDCTLTTHNSHTVWFPDDGHMLTETRTNVIQCDIVI